MNRLDKNQRAILREYLTTRVALSEEASCSLAQHELAALLDMADKCEELETLVVTTTNEVDRDELREKLAVALWGVHADANDLADTVLDVLKKAGVTIPPK